MTTEELQQIYLLGGHVCGECIKGIHGTCFGTCICAYCQEYWKGKQ